MKCIITVYNFPPVASTWIFAFRICALAHFRELITVGYDKSAKHAVTQYELAIWIRWANFPFSAGHPLRYETAPE